MFHFIKENILLLNKSRYDLFGHYLNCPLLKKIGNNFCRLTFILGTSNNSLKISIA